MTANKYVSKRRLSSLFITLGCVIGGCGAGSQVGPTQPGLVVRIGSGTNALKSGEQQPIRVFLRDASGKESETAATWSIENDSVVQIVGGDIIAAISPGVTTIKAVTDQFTESVTVTVVQNIEGLWAGTYTIKQCVRVSGGGSSYCRFVEGGSYYLRLQLSQQGQQITGHLDLADNLGTRIIEGGSVSGNVDVGGTIQLNGKTTSVVAEQPGSSEVVDWVSAINTENRLDGRFTLNRTFTNSFGQQVSREDCMLNSLLRD